MAPQNILSTKLLFLFKELIKRIHRSRLRRIMRGYRALKQSGKLGRIACVKQALTEQSLGLARKQFFSYAIGCGAASGELVVRQYLLLMVGGLNLNRALLLGLGDETAKVVFPLPKIWREVLKQHGFQVANLRSALLWKVYVCAALLYGVAKISMVVLAGIRSDKRAALYQKRYAYFADLGPGNLPKIVNGSQSHDVISWYLQWPGRKPDLDSIRHSAGNALPATVSNVVVLSQPRVIPALTGWAAIFSYAVWGLTSSLLAALDCLRGRWWHALLLNQAALAAQVRALPRGTLAQEYLFHNSNWIYRPLWTYEAERLGSTISFYFYSTNCEPFKGLNGYPALPYGWGTMSWPRYLVWDKYQDDFVQRVLGKRANINVVGPIWFQSSAVEMSKLDKPCVAVFDVTPHRFSSYCTLGIDGEFYTPAVANPFLLNVSGSISRHGVLMLWKRKRNIGRSAHPQYRRLAEQLAENGHVLLVDPDISAKRVIESSVAVISMPFTSTALIAREMGKPSVYYDPTGLVQKDDRAAHGIDILSGIDELEDWLSVVLEK